MPLPPLERRGRAVSSAIDRVYELAAEYGISRVVIGLPLHMDGRRGPEVEEVEAFGGQVAARGNLSVEYMDERWTTVEATRALRELGVRGRKLKRHVDSAAAAVLLRAYLQQHTKGVQA